MTVSFTHLHSLGFSASHKITLDADGEPRFVALEGGSGSESPAVYVWVAHKPGDDAGAVLYVGKAGKGVKRRLDQHQNGFINSGTGRKNAAALRGIIGDQDLSVTVMARVSERVTLFGKTVSMYATEENALCELFSPTLNRAVFPDLTSAGGAPVNIEATLVEDSTCHPLQSNADRSRVAELINGRLRIHDEGTVEDMLAQVEAYGPQEVKRLAALLELLEARILDDEHVLKVIRGYTDQPQGCNGLTTLGFGRIVERNFAPNGWVARIYLTDAPRVSFPLSLLNSKHRDRAEVYDKLFEPLDVDAFLRDPDGLLQAE